jgi:cathepsin X
MQYLATDFNCTAINVCKNCKFDLDSPTKLCTAQKPQRFWYVDQHGPVTGVNNMMAEIYSRGPIACSIAVTPAFVAYTKGVFRDTTGATNVDHEISIVGWGTENNTPYWIVRNSWGTFWGEQGFAKVIRGVNNMQIESDCVWATPKP